jgi:predicted GNAT family N-acyltransferase
MEQLEIRLISAEETHDIRHEILRKGQPRHTVVYKEDSMEGSFHLGAFVDGKLVGITSLYPESHPDLNLNLHRLRGMATLPAVRGKGYGVQLVREAEREVERRGSPGIWCNARTSASGFYRKLGFEVVGDEFDMPGIGPHYLMRTLR